MSANKLLRQFYGLDIPNESQEILEIDSPKFSAKEYFEKKAKNDSTPNLLAHENTLVSEIRSLDNELQTLVYDNYTKFLGASDIVKDLGSHISTLRDKISTLKISLNNVSNHFNQMNNIIDPNRQKVHRLIGISRLLERVEFISNLPKQLKKCLDTDQYSLAVNLWIQVKEILKSQQHYPSFEQIYTQCDLKIKEIESQIRGQMLNTDISVENSINNAELLFKLQIPLNLICSQLSHHRFLVIDNTLEYNDLPNEPLKLLNFLDELILNDLNLFITLFKEKLFKLENNNNKIKNILNDFIINTFDRIIQLFPNNKFNDFNSEEINLFIKLFLNKFEIFNLKHQISLYIRKLLQFYTETQTLKIYNIFLNLINNNNNNDLNFLLNEFINSINSLINNFLILINLESGQFLIQQISRLFFLIFEYFNNNNLNNNYLILILFFQKLSDNEISNIFINISKLQSDLPLHIQDQLIDNSKKISINLLNKFIENEKLKINIYLLNNSFIFNNNEIISPSNIIQNYLNQINNLYNSIKSLINDYKGFEDQEDINSWKIQRSPYKNHLLFNSNNLTPQFLGIRDDGLQIERMFTTITRLHLNQSINLSISSLINSIIIYSLKSFLEIFRLNTFNNISFNQIQLDFYFLFNSLNNKVEKLELFNALIEEVLNTVYERTFNPKPLEINVLSTIYEHFNKKNTF